jgi:hypothetical protein
MRDREPAGAGADNAGHRREPPIMLAEIIAASSFLDFGGIPDARYFHALYDWRLSEAEKYSTSDLIQRTAPTARATCFYVRKGIFKGGSNGRTNIRRSGSWRQDASQICGPKLLRFATPWTAAIVSLLKKWNIV